MRIGLPVAALAGVALVSLAVPRAAPLPPAAAMKMFSVPVSPSVVATVANQDGQLAMLALWRGGTKWYGSGTATSSSAGGGQNGSLGVSAQYGSVALDLAFDPAAQRLTLHGRSTTVPKGANVLLIDGVDQPGGGKLVKAFYLDAAGANMEIRYGLRGLAPLLSRSAEVVSFLQCDKWPQYVGSAEPCAEMKRNN